MNVQKAYLTLENGKVFQGYRFGANGDRMGELVFNTSMVGYVETLTDPSYYGQIVAQTFPLLGNYGVNEEDCESNKAHLFGYIVREKCDFPSNFRCQKTLETFMKEKDIVGIYGIDTRELTKIIREAGVMNAAITAKPVTDFNALSAYKVTDAVKNVTVTEPEIINPNGKYTVVVYDFGSKKSVEQELIDRNCKIVKIPANYTAEKAFGLNPDGIFLSNGPGDPTENTEIIENIKKLIGKKPIFAVGLGHQMFALAMGSKTKKMKHGHRGSNQPVKNAQTGGVHISAQNHGYVVDMDGVKGKVEFVNANDNTCEAISYADLDAFTMQYAPKANGGANDANYLFDQFVERMECKKENK